MLLKQEEINKKCETQDATNGANKDPGNEKSGLQKFAKWVVDKSSFTDWCLVVFTGVLAGAAIYQFNVMRGQLDIMREDQRPWLAVDLTGVPTPDGKGATIPLPENMPIIMPLRITVTKSVARSVDGNVWVEVLNKSESPHLDSANWLPTRLTAGIYFPNAPRDTDAIRMRIAAGTAEMQFNPLTTAEYRDVTEGRAWIAVHGNVTYHDASDIPHWTKFCLRWAPHSGFYNAQSCAAYNDVDSNK